MYVIPPSSPKPGNPLLSKFRKQNEQYGNPSQGRESAYAVGTKIYNGTSNSPHSGGGLDKSGYIERDASAKAMKTNSLEQYLKKLGRG